MTLLAIGDLARRTGLSVSAIRYYEARGLLSPVRSAGNQRRFPRADIRRLAFARIAQQLGLSLGEIEAELASALSVSAKVRLVSPKTIERSEGKAKRVIDKRMI